MKMGTSPDYEIFEYLKTGTFSEEVQRLSDLKDRKTAIEEEMKELRMSLGVSLDSVGIKSVLWRGRPVTLVERKGSAVLNKPKLKMELVERGVPAQIVMDSMEAATTVGKASTTVSLGKAE
jgi:hypothetical protein